MRVSCSVPCSGIRNDPSPGGRCARRMTLVMRNQSAYADREVARLIEFALDLVGAPPGVAVHVRGNRKDALRGMAYDGIPTLARVPASCRYLVTLRIGPAARFPALFHCHGLRSLQPLHLASWQEALLYGCAHEFRHLRQFEGHLRRSELDAERFARYALLRFRGEEAPHPATQPARPLRRQG